MLDMHATKQNHYKNGANGSALGNAFYRNNNKTNNNNGIAPDVCSTSNGGSTTNDGATIRCVLVGDACVGKTSMIVAYTRNGFSDRYVPTAFDNYSVTVNVDDKPLKLELCDTAGRSEFDTIRPLSYADANVFLLCFSVAKPESFSAVTERWLPELRAVDSTAPVILVGTQNDLRFGRVSNDPLNPTDSATLSRIAKQYQAEYIECSAVTQRNLKEVFDLAILYGLNRRTRPKPPSRNSSTTLQAKAKNAKLTKKVLKSSNAKNIDEMSEETTTRVSIRDIMSNALNGSSNANNCRINGGKVGKNAGAADSATMNAEQPFGMKNGYQKISHNNLKGGFLVNRQDNSRNRNENKLPSSCYDGDVGRCNNNGKNNYTSSPYGNWFSSNENRPTIKPHAKAAPVIIPNNRYENGGCSTKPAVQPSTTFKDGFRKLVSMTRRFL